MRWQPGALRFTGPSITSMESLPQMEGRISSESQRAVSYIHSTRTQPSLSAEIGPGPQGLQPKVGRRRGFASDLLFHKGQDSGEHHTEGLESDNQRARDNRGRLKVGWLDVFWEPARAAGALPLRVAQRLNTAADTTQLRIRDGPCTLR